MGKKSTSRPVPRVALAQIEVKAGLLEHNLQRMRAMVEAARGQGAHLVAFPEMCVGGYLVGDRWTEDAFARELMEANEEIRSWSHGLAIAWGNVHLDTSLEARGFRGHHPNRDGRTRRYNAVYVAQDQRWAPRRRENGALPPGVQPKSLLPSYRFFDDERYFFSLPDVARDLGVKLSSLLEPFRLVVAGEEVLFGFELCEDLWCKDYRKRGRALNPTRHLIDNGAQYVVNASASPWTFGKNGARDRRVLFLKEDSGQDFVPFLYVNVVGAQNNGKNIITFDGGSTVYDRDGRPIQLARAPYTEELLLVERYAGPAVTREEPPRIAQKYAALLQGIRHMRDLRGDAEHPRFVIGLSGGVDSAVTAALLVAAVGAERVLSVNMPTRYNAEKTILAARTVAERLGIRHGVLPIEELVEVNRRLVSGFDLDGSGRGLSSLNEENIQAKIRGTSILSNLAAKYGAVFTNNGNKLEVALGYATLYGDVGGAISVLGDLTKAEVYALARHLNTEVFGREVIPELLLPDALFRFRPEQIEPSAELKEAQVDPMRFGYHCALLERITDYHKASVEDVLRWYLEGVLHQRLGVPLALLERWGVHAPAVFLEDLDWFARQVRGAVFKRVQAPPIVVTSKTAFGYDLRESMLAYRPSRAERALAEQIRALPCYTPAGA